MEWIFKNNGEEYVFAESHCGGGKFIVIDYNWLPGFKLRSIELIEKGRICKKSIENP